MIPFPLSEIYFYVLVEGWRIRELWRKGDEIKLCVYVHSKDVEDFIKKSGLRFEDAINLTQHLEYSIYEHFNN